MASCQGIYLLITPLSCYYRYQFNKIDIVAARNNNRRVPFRRLQHWAIQVGDDFDGKVYEVTSFDSSDGSRDLRISSGKEWRKARAGRARRKLFISVTGRHSDDLEAIADSIWEAVLEDQYRSFSRNCQSFAELFKEVIEDRDLLSEEDSTEVLDMPSSFNPLYAMMHLKEAKAAAVKWSRKAFKRNGASCRHRRPDGGLTRMPSRRNDRWRQLVNEISNERQMREAKDFRSVVERANRLQRLEREPPQRATRRLSRSYR